MKYLYNFANASLTLRVVEYLQRMPQLPVKFITVIHQIDGWVDNWRSPQDKLDNSQSQNSIQR